MWKLLSSKFQSNCEYLPISWHPDWTGYASLYQPAFRPPSAFMYGVRTCQESFYDLITIANISTSNMPFHFRLPRDVLRRLENNSKRA